MKTTLRFVSLLVLSFLIAAPMMAACRQDSPLDISQIIDPNATTLQKVPGSSNMFAVFFAVKTGGKISFMCGRKPAGCSTPDGITYKPALSTNVASAIPTAECRAMTITVNNTSTQAVAAFRIRFENNLAPQRKTFKFMFDPKTLKFSFQQVPEPIDPAD